MGPFGLRLDAQREAEYEDECRAEDARRRRVYRCGGWAAYDGPCGATDCEDCYGPAGDPEDEDSEAGDLADDFSYEVAAATRNAVLAAIREAATALAAAGLSDEAASLRALPDDATPVARFSATAAAFAQAELAWSAARADLAQAVVRAEPAWQRAYTAEATAHAAASASARASEAARAALRAAP